MADQSAFFLAQFNESKNKKRSCINLSSFSVSLYQENEMTRHFLTLSSSELLSLAIEVEASNAHRYREWADRFRPFNDSVSVLLDDMAIQSDKHGDDLRSSHGEQFDDPVRSADPREIAAHGENAVGAGEHFFVIDNGMAHSILTSAIHTLSKVRSFYKTIFMTTKSAALRKVYESRTSPDRGYVGRLNEFLQRFLQMAPSTPAIH